MVKSHMKRGQYVVNHLKYSGLAFRHQEQLPSQSQSPRRHSHQPQSLTGWSLSDSHLRGGSQVLQAISVSPGKSGETSVYWTRDTARVARVTTALPGPVPFPAGREVRRLLRLRRPAERAGEGRHPAGSEYRSGSRVSAAPPWPGCPAASGRPGAVSGAALSPAHRGLAALGLGALWGSCLLVAAVSRVCAWPSLGMDVSVAPLGEGLLSG